MGAQLSWFPGWLAETAGAEFGQNLILMSFTQVASAAIGVFAPNGELDKSYAAEQENCSQVQVIGQQVQQLQDMTTQGEALLQQSQQLGVRLQQLRSATLVYAQSLADQQRRFRTRASVTIILNIYITLVLVFWIIRKLHTRHSAQTHAELDLSILEAAQRDAALAAALQAAPPAALGPPSAA